MGIPVGQYDRELISRTIELNKKYKGIYNITLLMNSLLSLIVLPNEKKSYRNIQFLKNEIIAVPQIQNLLAKNDFIFEEGGNIKKKAGIDTFVPNPRNLQHFLKKIRNGISHQHIEPISDENNKWIGVIIRDIHGNVCTLQVHFTIKELKSFALFIGESYLKELQ
jgi:hypothetical protein